MGTTRREVLGSSGVLSREGVLRRSWVQTVLTEMNNVGRNTKVFLEPLETCSELGLELGERSLLSSRVCEVCNYQRV